MHAEFGGDRLRLIANLIIVVLAMAWASLDARGADLISLGGELPELEFDVPPTLVARDVTPHNYQPLSPGERLVEVCLPVSVVVVKGDVNRIREVIVEIDGAEAGLRVHDFSPDTRLASDRTDQVTVQTTRESKRGIDASLGGALPVAGGTAHLTPSITGGASDRTASTITETRLAPKQAVLVSGAVNHRRGVYFKLRRSTQTTLEGEHDLAVTFVAPADWAGGALRVDCVARGEKRWLFVKQRKVWNSSRTPVEVRLASYTVAKPVLTDAAERGLQAAVEVAAQAQPSP